jgi:RNA polymerase sigma-70 factor (ECF subfamily)
MPVTLYHRRPALTQRRPAGIIQSNADAARPRGRLTGNREGSIASEDAQSDAAAIHAVLAGDVEQYAALVRRYSARFAGYAVRLLGTTDAAEDAMQEAFIRAYDRLGQCRDPENFAGWFFLILRNCCFAEARRLRRHESLSPDGNGKALADPRLADGPLEQAQRVQALQRALLALTPEQREVFVLRHYEGLSYQEINQQTGTPVAALKMRMHRAYDRLRAILREEI